METKAIYDMLSERLPGAVRECSAATADPFIVIEPERVCDVMLALRDEPALRFDMLQLVTAVDRLDRFEIVYHLTSLTHGHRIALKAILAYDHPRIASIVQIYPAANWHERETYDLMGIVFEGHPDFRRIFLPDDWDGHPLRKNYQAPESYHGISNKLS